MHILRELSFKVFHQKDNLPNSSSDDDGSLDDTNRNKCTETGRDDAGEAVAINTQDLCIWSLTPEHFHYET